MKSLKDSRLQALVFILFIFVSSAHAVEPTKSEADRLLLLRFDGVYKSEINQTDPDLEYWQYIRFYEDGTVITVSSTGNPTEIDSWFRKELSIQKGFSRGQYEIKGSEIIFSSTSEAGTVDYNGTIHEKAVDLYSFSHISGNKSKKKYSFVPLPNH